MLMFSPLLRDNISGLWRLTLAFLPSRDGFKFVNSFSGYPLPADVSKLLPDPGQNFHFGLCGGMSAAARDFYLSGQQIPDIFSPPAKDTPLYQKLYERQLDTLRWYNFKYALKFIMWMARDDNNQWFWRGTRKLTCDEYPKIAMALTSGDGLAVLGLVLVKVPDKFKIWENHQVLGYSLQEGPDRQTNHSFIVSIYDPNFPGRDDITISARTVKVGRHPIFFWRLEQGFKCVEHIPQRAGESAVDK